MPPAIPACLQTPDGLRLAVREWPLQAARGTVLLVHGLGEHSGRYQRLAAELNGWGWAVVGYDHRGHGRSEGPRGGLPRALSGARGGDALLDDLAHVVDRVRAGAAAPLVLLGHSLGGLIAARFVAGAVRPVDALVLSSPALDAGLSVWQRALLGLMERLSPDRALRNGLKLERLSHDPAVVQAYRTDPLVHANVTARLVRFMLDAAAYTQARAPRWGVPTLLMWAGRDGLVDPAGSERFAAAAPRSIVATLPLTHMYHEIFNEPDRADALNVLRDWLDGLVQGR